MFKSLALVIVLALTTSSALAAPQRYSLDSEHTTVAFLVEHAGFAKTLGQFTEVSGAFTYDEETRQVSDVSISVKTGSLQTENKARDKHVRSKDFLNTSKYPDMIFTADGAFVAAQGTTELSGSLQLLAEKRPLTLSLVLNKSEKYPFGHKKFTLGISARGALQRKDYGMDYGVANGLVGDTVELIIETEANID
ncbi:YceI family protein [Granulosicoccus antarcticus]|uniref:Protein YceI n=1 Tax=Granulosicoccus antarcticus IMCC3135 TaxID=1192854 RepID=A0A2Z2NJB9_9GAMM|nr:YceI family protein [Granulosicoccus antarcticus]ASJ71193.1 Protein YceI [Granulosicoccus antarcticus IMCC3135]